MKTYCTFTLMILDLECFIPRSLAISNPPFPPRCANVRLQALLSERINDCHVQNYFRTRRRRHEDAGDMSHINYRSASTMILEARARLLEEIQSKHGLIDYMHDGDGEGNAVAFVGKIDAEVRDLNDLLDEATLALARIFSKEGHVSARFDDHGTALVRGPPVSRSAFAFGLGFCLGSGLGLSFLGLGFGSSL